MRIYNTVVSAIETIALIKIYQAMIFCRTIRVNARSAGSLDHWIVEGASGEIPVHGTLPRLRSGFLSLSHVQAALRKASFKACLHMHRICSPWNYLTLYSGRLFRGLLMQGISPALDYHVRSTVDYSMYVLTYIP